MEHTSGADGGRVTVGTILGDCEAHETSNTVAALSGPFDTAAAAALICDTSAPDEYAAMICDASEPSTLSSSSSVVSTITFVEMEIDTGSSSSARRARRDTSVQSWSSNSYATSVNTLVSASFTTASSSEP